MVTVAFVLDLSNNWLGGVNYYRNLLTAISQYASDSIRVKVFLPKGQDMDAFRDLSTNIEFVSVSFPARWTLSWFVRKLWMKFFHEDRFLARHLRRHGVDVLSHVLSSIRCLGIKNIAWIPDFQHKYLPELFSKKELSIRDAEYERMAVSMDKVILSSETAKADFIKYYPQYKEKACVLRFGPVLDFDSPKQVNLVEEKYGITGKYFFLPNQYWKHKNHKVVLQALSILKEEGRFVRVVSTGNTSDYRALGHFAEIEAFIKDHELGDRYLVLGMIPYADVQALAEASLGYINPSFFEGWSTTVEEAKYRGKPILLSDLKVHREQAPRRGVFFDPDDPEDLAKKMWDMWQQPIQNEDVDVLKRANEAALQKFAKDYCDIVQSC
jgi:glycosyltransferase, family 1